MYYPNKILVASMLFCLTAPIFYLGMFFIKQQHIQHEMKEKLEYASLQSIAIEKKDFKWVKKNKEIIIDGHLFDVKSIKVNENEIIVTGLFDYDEDKLEKVFSSVMHQKKNETAPINKFILKFIFSPATIINQTGLTRASFCKSISNYHFYQEAVASGYHLVIVPPPII